MSSSKSSDWQLLLPVPPSRVKKKAKKPHKYYPTDDSRRIIETMAGYGFSVHQLASITGIHVNYLYRNYGEQMRNASHRKDLELIESAWMKALGGPKDKRDWEKADVNMQKFLLERVVSQRHPEFAKPPDQLQIDALMRNIDLSKLTDAQVAQFLQLASIIEYDGNQTIEHDEAETHGNPTPGIGEATGE